MAGKIVADTLEHSTAGSIATNYVVNGSAKAWVNVDGTGTVSLRDSFNATSLTDNGTGDYSHSFTNSMGNVNHASSGMNNALFAGNFNRSISLVEAASASSVRYKSGTADNATTEDQESSQVITHGDLA
jgi:hypothetical protein